MIFSWNEEIVLVEKSSNNIVFSALCTVDSIVMNSNRVGEIIYKFNLNIIKMLKYAFEEDVYKDTILTNNLEDIFIFNSETSLRRAIKNKDFSNNSILKDYNFRDINFYEYSGTLSDIFLEAGKRLSIDVVEVTRSEKYNNTVFIGKEINGQHKFSIDLADLLDRYVHSRELFRISIIIEDYSLWEVVVKVIPKIYSSGFFMYSDNASTKIVEGTLLESQVEYISDNKYMINLGIIKYNEYALRETIKGFLFCRSYSSLKLFRNHEKENISKVINKMFNNKAYKEVTLELPIDLKDYINNSKKIIQTNEKLIITNDEKSIDIPVENPTRYFNSHALFLGGTC